MRKIKVICDSCGANYRVDPTKIPAKGARAKCKKCGANIVIKRPTRSLISAAGYFCPRCKAPWDQNDNECFKCGLIFDDLGFSLSGSQVTEKLETFSELLKKGLITREEYDAIKKRLLESY